MFRISFYWQLIGLILLFIWPVPYARAAVFAVRSELHRYTLLRDRIIIERRQKRDLYENFFDFQIHASSGLKSLIGDIKDATDPSKSSVQQTADLTTLLTKSVNQEKFLDVNLYAGIPLPYFSLKAFQVLPNIFYNLNMGASISVNNQASAVNPEVQSFIKVDKKLGINLKMKWRKKNHMNATFYRMNRQDLNQTLSLANIITEKKVIDFSKLNQDNESFNFDLDYSIITKKRKITFMIQEFKMFGDSSENYGSRPLVNFQYTHYPQVDHDNIRAHFFAGWHFRQRYEFFEGFYIGAKVLDPDFPLRFTGMLDTEMMTLIPSVELHWIKFHYSLKLAYRNPIDHIWVSTIHGLSLSIPM